MDAQLKNSFQKINNIGISAAPGWWKLLPMAANIGLKFLPTDNAQTNNGAVDVTGQLKGSSNFQYQNPGITYPSQVQSNQNIPQGQSTLNPYGITMNGMVKGYNDIMTPEGGGTKSYLNPMSTGVIDYKGYEPAFDNNMQVPNGFNTEMNSFQNKNVANVSNSMLNRSAINSVSGQPVATTEPVQPAASNGVLTGVENEMNLIDSSVKSANIYNTIGQGMTGIASVASLVNEANKKPSQAMVSPEFKLTELDSNQSSFINSNRKQIENAKNAQKRLYMDLGINPMIAGTMAENWASDQLLKVTAEAERTRQGIEASQEQINANIQGQANQMKAATDQFNIQKQMQENQLAGQNISQSLMTLAGSVIGIGQGNISNNLWGSMAKNAVVQSYVPQQ